MSWFTDIQSWTNMYDLKPEKIPLFIKCIQNGIKDLIDQKFNSCFLTMYQNDIESEKEYSDWYGDNFMESLVMFGGNSLFHLHNKSNSILIPVKNGSMIVMRESVKKYWNITLN